MNEPTSKLFDIVFQYLRIENLSKSNFSLNFAICELVKFDLLGWSNY